MGVHTCNHLYYFSDYLVEMQEITGYIFCSQQTFGIVKLEDFFLKFNYLHIGYNNITSNFSIVQILYK